MKLPTKNKIKISVLLLILPFFLFLNISIAKADIFSEMQSGVATFVQFVVQGFHGFQNSICNQSVSASNQSSFGKMQINLQKAFCGGYVSPTSLSVGQATSSNIFNPNNLFTFSIPGALLPTAVPNVSDNALFIPTSSSDNTSVSTINSTINNSVPVSTNASTTSETTNLPGGLSGSTAENGVSLNPSEIIYWTNIARSDNGGLPALNENSILDKIAKIRTDDMFAKQYFDHYSPTGDNVSLEANANGYSYITIGENIALGNFGSSRDLVTAWMNSPGHRANILNTSYMDIGVAAEQGEYQGSEVWISSEVFGEPLSKCPSPDASLKQEISNSAGMTNAEIQTLVNEYNQQVATFNACI
jgi:uncharacterized protein YkwD